MLIYYIIHREHLPKTSRLPLLYSFYNQMQFCFLRSLLTDEKLKIIRQEATDYPVEVELLYCLDKRKYKKIAIIVIST